MITEIPQLRQEYEVYKKLGTHGTVDSMNSTSEWSFVNAFWFSVSTVFFKLRQLFVVRSSSKVCSSDHCIVAQCIVHGSWVMLISVDTRMSTGAPSYWLQPFGTLVTTTVLSCLALPTGHWHKVIIPINLTFDLINFVARLIFSHCFWP